MKTEGHLPMKREPNERGQTDDRPNLIEKRVAEALFACRHATREKGGGGRRKKREGEKGRNEGVPSDDPSIQGHTKKEGLPAMTKASSDAQGRRKGEKKERERKREREREAERERERERKKERQRGKKEGRKGSGQVFPATSKRPGIQGEGCT